MTYQGRRSTRKVRGTLEVPVVMKDTRLGHLTYPEILRQSCKRAPDDYARPDEFIHRNGLTVYYGAGGIFTHTPEKRPGIATNFMFENLTSVIPFEEQRLNGKASI